MWIKGEGIPTLNPLSVNSMSLDSASYSIKSVTGVLAELTR